MSEGVSAELPPKWSVAELADVATLVRGVSYKKDDATHAAGTGLVPILRATNITGSALTFENLVYVPSRYVSDVQYIGDGDIVIASSSGSKEIVGKSGQVSNSPQDASFGAFCTLVRPAPEIDARYLGLYFQSPDYREAISEISAGSNINNIKSSELIAHRIPVAPKNEQTRIVEKLEELLSDLDAGVAELKAAQRKLAQYRQSLLKAAVEGALTADWRAARAQTGKPQEAGAELLQRILTERRARWEANQLAQFTDQGKTPPNGWQDKYKEPLAPDITDLRVLPGGWVWGSLDQVVAESLLGIDRGKDHQSLVDGNAGYIKMNSVSMEGSVDTSALVRVDASPEEIDRYSLASGDLLFNTRNSRELVGKTGMIQEVDPATVYNNNLMRLRFDGSITPAFACHQMCSVAFRGRMEKVKKATTSVAAVYAKDLFPLQVVVPPMEEQIAIDEMLVGFLSAVDQQEAAVQSGLRQSAAQRKNILKAAFAGQLVPQDPNDEPASVLLERIRAERAASTATTRGRKPRTTA